MATTVSSAQAQNVAAAPQQSQPVEVEIDQGVLRPLQIAIVPFSGDHGADISSVISGNLKRSGFFEPLNPAGFIETGLTLANAPNFPQWTQIGAQAVLYGGVTPRAPAAGFAEALPKVLCLHGGGGTAAAFQAQLSELTGALSSEFEFFFPQAPESGGVWVLDPPGGKGQATTDPNWASASDFNVRQ